MQAKCRWLGVALIAGVLGGCQFFGLKPEAKPPANKPVEVSGVGKIVELNTATGTGVMEIKGKKTRIWWRNEMTAPSITEGGNIWNMSYDTFPSQTRVYQRPFPAHEGDTVEYKGMETYGEIYLTGLRVKPAK